MTSTSAIMLNTENYMTLPGSVAGRKNAVLDTGELGAGGRGGKGKSAMRNELLKGMPLEMKL